MASGCVVVMISVARERKGIKKMMMMMIPPWRWKVFINVDVHTKTIDLVVFFYLNFLLVSIEIIWRLLCFFILEHDKLNYWSI